MEIWIALTTAENKEFTKKNTMVNKKWHLLGWGLGNFAYTTRPLFNE